MESIAVETSDALHAAEPIRQLEENVARVIRGKREVIRLATVCLLSRGHILVEDVPGVGKTTLAQALARSLGLSFQRIQFTSDLLPSDIIGVSIFNQKNQTFEFVPGPLFANVVLADEINRATPKAPATAVASSSASRPAACRGCSGRPRPWPCARAAATPSRTTCSAWWRPSSPTAWCSSGARPTWTSRARPSHGWWRRPRYPCEAPRPPGPPRSPRSARGHPHHHRGPLVRAVHRAGGHRRDQHRQQRSLHGAGDDVLRAHPVRSRVARERPQPGGGAGDAGRGVRQPALR